MAFPWIPALIGGAIGYGQSASQRKAANRAGDIAEGLSQEQRALLSELLKNLKQYGGPLLERGWDWAKPGESAWQRNQYALGREDINRAFRPAYSTALAGLSSRNLLSTPNTYAAPMISAMDRARGRAIAGYTGDWRARMAGDEGRRLQQFSNMLAQLSGQQTTGAGAYNWPISTMGGLASAGAAGQYDWLNALIRLMGMLKQGNRGDSAVGATGPGVTGAGGAPPLGTPPWAYS